MKVEDIKLRDKVDRLDQLSELCEKSAKTPEKMRADLACEIVVALALREIHRPEPVAQEYTR